MGITTVTSEALQLKIRQLLPSQLGFGTDLTAQDTIVPIVDLTRAAEGSDVPEILQQAIAFGSQTAFQANGTTVTVSNTPGFYRIFGVASAIGTSGNMRFEMTDGATTKTIWGLGFPTSGSSGAMSVQFDFVVFLRAGDSIDAVSTSGLSLITGSVRQIADTNGTLVNPTGFTPQ